MKLAVHYVQLRIRLTRLTSDYSEGLSHCSTEPVVYPLVIPDSGYSYTVSIYLSIQPLRITHDRFHVISPTQWLGGLRYTTNITPRSFLITLRASDCNLINAAFFLDEFSLLHLDIRTPLREA